MNVATRSTNPPGGYYWFFAILSALAIGVRLLISVEISTVLLFLGVTATVVTICAMRIHGTQGHTHRPDGLLILAAAQVSAFPVLLDTSDLERVLPEAIAPSTFHAVFSVTATFLSVVGVIRLVAFRLGTRAKITEREVGIFSAGVALTFYVIAAGRTLGESTGLINSLSISASGAAGVFSVLFLLWLLTFDRSALSFPFLLAFFPQVVLLGNIIALSGFFEESSLNGWLIALQGSSMLLPIAAYLHPQAAQAFAISIADTSEVNVGRSAFSFLVIFVGPLLVAVDRYTDQTLSLATITVGSSIVSVMVATHLLMLLRRWAHVEHLGRHDPLTGLPNRVQFFKRIETALEGARMRGSNLCVMFLDLDRFKAVNDTLGHDKGDLLLKLVAERLGHAAGEISGSVTVARLGGDEFAILVPSLTAAQQSEEIGRTFLDQFLEPFNMGLRDIYVTPSIGVAQFPEDGRSVKELMENADTAMFEAKGKGRNSVVRYVPNHRTHGKKRLEIEAGLHKALSNDELELFFQPQVDLETGRIFAVETLLRWRHPSLGLIGPDRFVPIAEESTLIDALGEWTLERSCRAAESWVTLGLPAINVAVNLSPRQFQKPGVLVDSVARALRESGLSPSRLELELTESLALEHPEEVNATLLRFSEMGIRTAIDDFGVGHTGLDYLDRIKVDTLKIDRSFINRIGESGAPLVTAVISLAKGLNLDVIAEGVETEAQVKFLRAHGCRYMQGYLFSRPLDGQQLIQVLEKQRQRHHTVRPLSHEEQRAA